MDYRHQPHLPQFYSYAIGMDLRITERRNRDDSSVAYYALAENIWNAQAKPLKRRSSTTLAARALVNDAEGSSDHAHHARQSSAMDGIAHHPIDGLVHV